VWVPTVSGVDVSVIYSDVDLMQLQVRASNRAFAAEVDTYVGHDAFAAAADQLKGFPLDVDDSRRLEIGPNVSLSFSTVDEDAC